VVPEATLLKTSEHLALDRVSSQRRTPVSMIIVGDLLRGADLLVIYATGLAMQRLYVSGRYPDDWQNYHFAALTGALLFLIISTLGKEKLFDLARWSTVRTNLARMTVSWAWAIVGVLTVGFAFKLASGFSRIWVSGWFLSALVAMATMRIALLFLAARWSANGRLIRNVAIIGNGRYAEQVIEAFRASGRGDIEIIGYFDDSSDGGSGAVAGCWRLGTVTDLVDGARDLRIDHLIVCMPWSDEQRLLRVLDMLRRLPIDIHLAPDLFGLRRKDVAFTQVCGIPMLEISRKPLRDWRLVAKWIEDFALAIPLMMFLAPLMLLIALAIKLDSPGPVFFRQKRYGFDNRLINVYKFRTMHHAVSDALAVRLVARGDPRVTRVGAFLRKSSLDELPQLFNVLRGEMSIVGPRPHPVMAKAADLLYGEAMVEYAARHRVKPGITGWAQVSGWRGETDTLDKLVHRVEHDLFYIENWSLRFDLLILLRTPFAMLSARNAY
jgi:Undecaprenyl-phosphate glucose phosphotransferase